MPWRAVAAGAVILAVAGCVDAGSDTTRRAVAVATVEPDEHDREERRLSVGVRSCNARGLEVAVEETAAEVRLSASHVGDPGDEACMDGTTVVLDEPLGDRRVVDASTGREVTVETLPDDP